MNTSELVAAAALAFRAYQTIGEILRRDGMDALTFSRAVEAEVNRIDKWLQDTNAAEDAVFDAPQD